MAELTRSEYHPGIRCSAVNLPCASVNIRSMVGWREFAAASTGPSIRTVAPIKGWPSESRTLPDTRPKSAPLAILVVRHRAASRLVQMTCHRISLASDLFLILAFKFRLSRPAIFSTSGASREGLDENLQRTSKGWICEMVSFLTLSVTLICTLYFPGWSGARSIFFCSVICAPAFVHFDVSSG